MARLLLAILLCLIAGCASTKPTPIAQPPAQPPAKPPSEQPSILPTPDPARGEPVAWIGSRYIYADDLERFPMDAWVAGLIRRFALDQKLEPTQEQVDRCIESFKTMFAKDPQSPVKGMPDFMARQMVKNWLIDKALYDKYGGTVIFQQANPMEPVGAYRAFFEEQERLNRLKFFDKTQHDKFWEYYIREHPFVADKADVDYSKPWWEQAPKEGR